MDEHAQPRVAAVECGPPAQRPSQTVEDHPRGRFATLAEVPERLEAACEQCVDECEHLPDRREVDRGW